MKTSETFLLEVKNINCEFGFLRDMLERISPSFTLDKDTFIFHAATKEEWDKIRALRDSLRKEGKTIIATKS